MPLTESAEAEPTTEPCPPTPTCKPMPCFDTDACLPAWLCSPPKTETKRYPVPEGVTIKPISQTGKNQPQQAFNVPENVTILPLSNPSCDSSSPPPTAVPVSGEMDKKSEECSGFFTRIASIFCCEQEPKPAGCTEPEPKPNDCPEPESKPVECPEPEVSCDCGCGCDAPAVDPAQEFLDKKCDCVMCTESERLSAPVVCLPEPDPREVGVKAQEMLDTSCGCYRCDRRTYKPLDENCPCGRVTCGECGCRRGTNDICVMCRYALRMQDERDFIDRRRQFCLENGLDEEHGPKCESHGDPEEAPFKWAKGHPVYEGGMTLDRTNRFLWAVGACAAEGFAQYAVTGQVVRTEEPEEECTCEEHLKKKRYRGGMTLEETQEYLWIKNKSPPVNQDEEA